MTKFLYLLFLFLAFVTGINAQIQQQVFDTARFSKNLDIASYMIEYEYHTQLALEYLSQKKDISSADWFSFKENNCWHTVGSIVTRDSICITDHLIIDSLYSISEFSGSYDNQKLRAYSSALLLAGSQFQVIRDTCNLYFSSFVYCNSDQTLSVWFFPSFQPSGQAIYGCEWEYVYDKNGKELQKKNAFINSFTGVWIGQPRELWLNYRSTTEPTIGSLFFALSFRDYFTCLRIVNQTFTSSTAKNKNDQYSWTHTSK